MTRVSSDCSGSCTSVRPSASAASSSTRLEMLFDPGSRTVPEAAAQRRKVEKGNVVHVAAARN